MKLLVLTFFVSLALPSGIYALPFQQPDTQAQGSADTNQQFRYVVDRDGDVSVEVLPSGPIVRTGVHPNPGNVVFVDDGEDNSEELLARGGVPNPVFRVAQGRSSRQYLADDDDVDSAEDPAPAPAAQIRTGGTPQQLTYFVRPDNSAEVFRPLY